MTTRVADMTPKQINNYPGFTNRMNRVISGAVAKIKNTSCSTEYMPIDYDNNPSNIICRVIIYAGSKQFAIVTASKTNDGKYKIDYAPATKTKFSVKDAQVKHDQ